jgi:hypothetical protein
MKGIEMRRIGKLASLVLVCSSVVMFAGCAAKAPTISKLYQNETANEPVTKMLVVSVGKERSNRSKMEKDVTKSILAQGGSAVNAVDLLSSNKTLNKDNVTKTVENNNIDAVLVINLLQSAVKIEVDEKRTETIIERPRPEKLLDVFVQRTKEVDIAREMNVNATVSISADLYSGKTGDKLWSIQTTIHEGTEPDFIIRDAAESIVKQLKKDGLI